MLWPFPESSHQLPIRATGAETKGNGSICAVLTAPPSRLELCCDPGYHQRFMNAPEVKRMAFFAGLRRVPRVICGVGACFFLASFFVQDFGGLGRALGLLGICIIFCGVALNLLMEISSCDTEPRLTKYLVVQSLLASFVAVAVFCLAVYVYRHGALPKFLPARYD
jgi:hypothetical protein